jgi:hypothetical protein
MRDWRRNSLLVYTILQLLRSVEVGDKNRVDDERRRCAGPCDLPSLHAEHVKVQRIFGGIFNKYYLLSSQNTSSKHHEW